MADITNCRSCDAQIVWLKTRAGKNMPVDVPKWGPLNKHSMYGKNPATETMYDAVTTAIEFKPDYMMSHFATCPNAAGHRKNA